MALRKWIGATVIGLVLALASSVLIAAPAQAAPAVKIAKIYYNSPGSDNWSNTSLNAEYVIVQNMTTRTQTITGWTIRDVAGWVYRFPTTSIAAGKTVVLRTGKGTNTSTTRHWQRTGYVWNNDRDTAYLRNGSGTLIHSCSYSNPSMAYRNC